MHWSVERAGVHITVRAESPGARRLAEVALANLRPRSDSQEQGVLLTVAGDEMGWELIDHASGLSEAPPAPGGLIYQLTDRIVHHVANGAKRHHCLHAAAVGYKGRALVMPADSGSGKSSLALWLVSQGFEYITDEMTLIDESYRIDGIARPIQIKTRGLSAVASLINSQDSIYRGIHSNSIPISSVGGRVTSRQRHESALFVFPEYKSGAGYSFSRMSAAEAGVKLMGNHINARNLEGHGFSSLMELVRNSPCYALQYGGFNCLPEGFSEELQELLQSAP